MTELIELFRKELLEVAAFRDSTVKIYISLVHKYIDYAKRDLKIDPLKTKAHHINSWLLKFKQNGSGYNNIKNCKAALNRFFSFLVKTGYIKDNPAKMLLRLKKVRSELNIPISSKVLYKLLDSFNRNTWFGMRNYIMVSTLWALGLRVGELTVLRLRDIRLDYDPVNRIGTVRVHGKGGKERILFIVDVLYDNIACYLEQKRTPKRKNAYLFPSAKSKAISIARVRQAMQEAAKRIGINERISPHAMRHTFATEMYKKNVPKAVIMDVMGHESLDETSLYIHIPEELKKEILNKLSVKERA